MMACVGLGGLDPVVGTAAGATVGAVSNFTLSRTWIFRDSGRKFELQVSRYALVSAVSLALNALGEYLAHDRAGVPYVAARALVAIAVSVGWNFPMQRMFAFPRT
jgi:putative flippase GtrA